MAGQQKRGRNSSNSSSPNAHMADVSELTGKMFKMNTTGRAPAPEILAAHRMDVQMHKPRDDIDDAKDDLIKQAKAIKRMHNLLDRYAASLDTFIKKVEQNEIFEIYAHAVLPSKLKIFKQHYVTSVKSNLDTLENYPAKLIEELYSMPKKTLEQVAKAQEFSASYVKRTHRETLNTDFSRLPLLPAQLLITALASTVTNSLYKPQVIDERKWMKIVNAFKRAFPNYKFSPIEMKYLNEWLHTGMISFHGKRITAIKPADSAQLKAALIQSFGQDGASYFGTSPLVASPTPPPSPDDDEDY